AIALSARIDAGKSAHMTFTGNAPLSESGQFDLRTDGTLDLAVFDPVLAANGRRLRGIVTLDGRVFGTLAAPRASGSAVLTGGEATDYLQGVRVTDIAAQLNAQGDTITISRLTGHAGRGTVSGSGTIALWATGIPLDLSITMRNARPLSTDQFNADLDAELKLSARLSERLTLSGTAAIQHGDINIAAS